MAPSTDSLDSIQKLEAKNRLLVFPLGGCGEFGMNMTAYIADQELYVVDCGIMFPDDFHAGVDAIIPNAELLFKRYPPKAYLITHGHEDHVGSVLTIASKYPAPIYASPWTNMIIQDKIGRYHQGQTFDIHLIAPNDKTVLKNLACTWIHVNHSIPMACSLWIEAMGHRIFHTGDFKIDVENPFEAPVDLSQLAKLGKQGCDLLVADSTNAPSSGMCPSEHSVREPLTDIIRSQSGRVYITTFSSNLWRLLTVLGICKELGRKVHISGAGMLRTLENAKKTGLLKDLSLPTIISESELTQKSSKDLVVLCTGCQGEPLAALARITREEHRKLKLKSGDCIIFSSRIIPGSEKDVYRIQSRCAEKGVSVITTKSNPNIHVSGHAYAGDLSVFMDKLRPKNLLAVHGTFSQITAQTQLASSTKAISDRVFAAKDGIMYELKDHKMSTAHQFEISRFYLDAFSRDAMEKQVVKERWKIGELGMAVLFAAYSETNSGWMFPPQLKILGLQPLKTKQEQSFLKGALGAVKEAIDDGVYEQSELEERVRIALRKLLNSRYKKKIVVLCNIRLV